MSYHHIFVSCIKTISLKLDSDIIICNTIPDIKNINIKFLMKIFQKVVFFDEKNSKKTYLSHSSFIRPKTLYYFNKIILNSVIVPDINFYIYKDIYTFHDKHFISLYLRFLKLKYILVEDGINHFNRHKGYFHNNISFKSKVSKIYTLLMKNELYNLISDDGTSSFIKHIEVTSKFKMNFKKKLHIVNKKTYIDSLKLVDKNLILRIFLSNKEKSQLKKRSILLITEPLFVDKMVESKQKQYEIYFQILKKYNQNNILIKPHPRDEFNYKIKFKDIFVLKKAFPIEVIDFVGNFFDKVITINSSAINLISNTKEKLILFDNFNLTNIASKVIL